MLKKSFFSLLFISCFSLAGAEPLQVVSVSPKGDVSHAGKRAIQVTFNQPVVALSEKNAFAQGNCPLVITPAVAGTCRYTGTQTLQFEPAENWKNATEYKVSLPAGFSSSVSKQKLAKEESWSFTTPRPSVQQVLPSSNEQWIDVRPLIYVKMSQPVDLEIAKQAFHLTHPLAAQEPSWWERIKAYVWSENLPSNSQVAEVPVTLRRLTAKEKEDNYSYLTHTNQVFVAEVQKDLPVQTPVTITLSKNLHGTEGPLGLAEDFTSVFHTYPKLQVAGANVEGCLPFDAHIDFTSPVRLSDLMKHMTISPQAALAEITEQEAQTLGYQRYVPEKQEEEKPVSHPVRLPAGTGYFVMPLSFLRLQPHQPVTVTIDKDLTDIYGQKLGRSRTFTVTNNGYCPAVVFKGGTGVLESYLPARHPIDVLNEESVEVYAARYGKETFIPFAQKDIPYCKQAELDKAAVQYNGKYDFHISADKTRKTYLDLSRFHPSAHESIIFSQVRVPSAYRADGFCWVGATDNITDLGVTLKTSQENTLVWVTSLQTGEPQGNLNVELRDSSNRTVWSGSTDANGLAWAPGWKELNVKAANRWSRPILYAFVSSVGGDAVLASDWNDGLELWRFNINYDYSPQGSTLKTALFTDRGVYRPGETVYLKGLTRQLKKGAWQLPEVSKVLVKIYNSRGDEMFKQTISYQKGSFDWSFVLPKEATTGTWQVYAVPENSEEDTIYSFQVEAVKQADFEVNVRELQPSYIGGQKAEFTASAQYLFGAPVAGGKVKWTVRRANEWFDPKGYDDYIFVPYFLSREDQTKDGLLVESSGELDEQGKINFSVPLPKVSRMQMLYAEVGVQAPTGQELFARKSIPLYPAEFYLGAYMERWSTELGEPVKAQLLAVNEKGKRVGPVQVKATIEKEEYLSIRKNGLAGRLEWVSQRRTKKYPSQTFTVGMDGYDFSFVPDKAGSYLITLSAKDSQGRTVRGGFEVTVYGKGEAYWKQNDDDILVLKQDKNSYQIGDTARILVQSPYENATALVSVEQNGVLDSWVTPISAGADSIEVPIKASYTPNVFVSVTLVRGRAEKAAYDEEGLDLAKPQGKTGYVQLIVSQEEREITTTVSPAKTAYRPGEEVRVKINTRVQDKPTPAEVTFMAVDDGILLLTGYQVPNLMKVFYFLRPLTVLTADNRSFLIGQRNFGEKGENRGGGGGLGNKLGGADLRSHFEFTPYFNATVRTNDKGKAEVKFKLPDNLTKFRLMAVASTVKEFGSGEATITVSKPLMITPKMPRFARQSDEFSCGAVVYNYEDEKGIITVTARASGAVTLAEKTQQIHVQKGAAQEVTWPCQAKELGQASVIFTAKGAKEEDAVQHAFSVIPVEKQQTLALYSATEDTQTQQLEKPDSVNPQVPSTVNLSLASTALLNLRGSMLYLLTYPYDCLEQKMSKIWPVIEGADLIKDFKLGDTTSYRKKTQEILDEIPSYQHSSGGLGYWPQVQPDPYVTAYALETAYHAQKAGYKVPTDSLKKAKTWLKGIFNGNKMHAYPYSSLENQTVRAYAVYVLALYGEKLESHFNTLYSHRNGLSLAGQAYLLQAAKLLGKGAEIEKTLAQGLLNQAQYGAQTIHFSSGENQPWLHMSAVKETAVSLDALLKAGAYLQQPYQVVRWLIEQLNAQGHWQNTNANAAVFRALHTYYTLQEAQEPQFKAAVSLDGKEVFHARFEGRSVETQQTAWPFNQVYAKQDQATVRVQKSGAGRVYYTLAQTYAPKAYTTPIQAGFTLTRQLTDLKGNPVTRLQAGERYKVTLKTSTSSAYSFVVLEDFIPAGFEIVNTNLATESRNDADSLQNSDWGGFERDEKYDDRIAIFADYLNAGENEYSYLVQAMTAGTYQYPSAWASQMYDPAVFGRNTTQTWTIEP